MIAFPVHILKFSHYVISISNQVYVERSFTCRDISSELCIIHVQIMHLNWYMKRRRKHFGSGKQEVQYETADLRMQMLQTSSNKDATYDWYI